MSKPQLTEYFLPTLKSFERKEELRRSEVVDFLQENYNLIQNDTPRRSFIMINTCLGYYLKANILTKTDEGLYKITERGKDILASNVEMIDVKFLRRFPEFDYFISGRYRYENKDSQKDEAAESENILPEDKILTAYKIHKKNLALELLEKIKNSSWQFFEVLVKDLLVAMGYGDPFDESRITRGNADSGIDGIIKADVLGLETICIQAKKWEGNIGRPEIQKFAGSLDSYKAKKGVFITTSSFSQEAKNYADFIEKRIILIDGERLAELMIDYNIGVAPYKKIELKRLDTDYFE
jgi:restriction system protein